MEQIEGATQGGGLSIVMANYGMEVMVNWSDWNHTQEEEGPFQ